MAKVYSLLKDHYEEERELDEDSLELWSGQEFILSKMDSALFIIRATTWGVQIPRRLGGMSTGAELSMDKKTMRRMKHLYTQVFDKFSSMTMDNPEVSSESIGPKEKSFGARLAWEEFFRDQTYLCDRQISSISTVSIQLGMEAWGLRVVNILTHERVNLDRIRAKQEAATRE